MTPVWIRIARSMNVIGDYKGGKNVQFDESNDNGQGRGQSGRISRPNHCARVAK